MYRNSLLKEIRDLNLASNLELKLYCCTTNRTINVLWPSFFNCYSLFHNGDHIRWFDICCYHLLCISAIKRNQHTRQGKVLLLINTLVSRAF